uniref:Integrase catalytic domain-containing protein n=1 Tax=Tanacetum cinerariifolium TaxID=118510 RepID=A0A6L2LUX2_TANCI|nr:hypothetical protein [Tanacetum cinerariifolium]
MSFISAQQTKLDLELVPKEKRLEIGKCNERLNPKKTQKEPTFQVILDALALTPCYSAFLTTTDVLEVYMHQFWDSIHMYENSYRSQPSGGYHVVPPPYIETFMPPKPDLIFHTAPTAVETDHLTFKDESKTIAPQIAPSFVQSFKQVKTPRHSVQPVETSILAATPKPTSLKSNSSSKRRIRKTYFVCKSVDHLIKDYDYHAKKMAQPTHRNYAHRAVTPVSAVVPKIMVTRPRLTHPTVTKSKSPIRWHITYSQSPKTSNSPPRVTAVQAPVGNPQYALTDKGVIDSGCSWHMIGNMSYLSKFEGLNGGYVAFRGNPKGGKISGKGKIKTGKLDFDDVYFVNELKFNLFSVSQMCDKKNSVLFTDTKCLVLSHDFKLPDESQVMFRVPRENNMYNVNLKNIVLSGDLTCLFAKETIDESNLWHRRLAHINFKTINKLVKGNLVRGLPTKVFENDNTCVACKKSKQHRPSCKTKPVSSVDQPLFRLHIDLFGPTFVKIPNKKSYCLVVTDDYSRFTWVFFLATKDETSLILKTFITGLDNQLSLKVKVIRNDNGTEFKNSDLNQFCGMKGIKREFSAEAINTACYVQNRVLVTKPHNKTPYELLHGRTPSIGFMRPFGCPVTILNTLDSLGSGPTWLFDIDSLTRTMNYQPVNAGNQTNPSAGFQENFNAEKAREEINQQNVLFSVWSSGSTNPQNYDKDAAFDEKEHDFDAKKPESEVNVSPKFKDCSDNSSNEVNATGSIVPTVGQNISNNTNPFSAAELKDTTYSDDGNNIGAEADFNNLESSIIIYVDNIIFGATNKDLCKSFKNLMKDKFQMSSMGEVTFFLGLQVKQKKDGIFINQDKYVAKILRKFGLTEEKSASTPIDTEKHLLKDPDVKRIFRYIKGEPNLGLWYPKDSPLDLVAYSDNDYAGASLDRKSTTGECQFLRCRLIFWRCNKQTVVATSSIEAEYIAALWNTVTIKRDNDVTRMQALVDKKKVVVTEAAIRDVLRLDDAEGVDCQPNEGIFTELARMGYEKPSTKLTFYKAFFSSRWKFLIHTILQSMSAKRTSWNEFSSAMASAVIFLSTGRKFNFSKYIFDSLVRNVDSTSKFYMYPCFLQLLIRKQVGDLSTHIIKYALPALTQKVFANIRRVGKRFSEVETPLFEGMLVGQEIEEEGDEEEHVVDVTTSDAAQGDDTATHGEVSTISQEPSIPSPTPPTPPPQPPQDLPSTSQRIDTSDDTVMDNKSNQRRIIDEMDKDDVVALMDDKEKDKKDEEAKEDEPTKVQEVVDVFTTAKLITEVVTTASETVTAASTIIFVAEPQVPAATITTAPPKVTAAPSRRRKRVVIRDPKEESTTSSIILDVAIDHVKLKAKEDPAVQRYKAIKRKPQTEAQARKNMMMYLKNVTDKKQMEEEKSRALQSINETPTQKAAKRRKLNEEVEDLKRHLEIVPDEDDDVYTEATLLARKVPVVDYEIIEINNKPYYKIIRDDGTHQLYISFLTLLNNFDREDLEPLWSLVKERFSTSKPKNFFDDFLLTTLGAMFEKPDVHAQVWKNQRTIHGQAKVKSWKLLESCGVHIITFSTTQLIFLVERSQDKVKTANDKCCC